MPQNAFNTMLTIQRKKSRMVARELTPHLTTWLKQADRLRFYKRIMSFAKKSINWLKFLDYMSEFGRIEDCKYKYEEEIYQKFADGLPLNAQDNLGLDTIVHNFVLAS